MSKLNKSVKQDVKIEGKVEYGTIWKVLAVIALIFGTCLIIGSLIFLGLFSSLASHGLVGLSAGHEIGFRDLIIIGLPTLMGLSLGVFSLYCSSAIFKGKPNALKMLLILLVAFIVLPSILQVIIWIGLLITS